MPSPIPNDRSQVVRITLIVAISVLGVALAGMVAFAVLRPHPKAKKPRAYTPAEETTSGTTPATGSVEAIGAIPAENPGDTSGDAGAPSGQSTATGRVRASKVAYRLGTSIQVANEDGTGATVVAQVPNGQFALSPDGLTLAVARAGDISLYEVETGRSVFSAPAEEVMPTWLPDSSAVMFMRVDSDSSPQIHRVGFSGGPDTVVGTGANTAVSPDGRIVVLVPAQGSAPSPEVFVSTDGMAFEAVGVPGGDPISVALGGDRVFVSTMSSKDGASIWSMALDGSDARQLVKPNSTTEKGATFGSMSLSPDGASLLYAAEGDDGYSRMFVVPAKGGEPRSLSSRRDDYPVAWSVSGSDIFFVEGNSFQGESTALYRVSPTGAGRTLVVKGAGL